MNQHLCNILSKLSAALYISGLRGALCVALHGKLLVGAFVCVADILVNREWCFNDQICLEIFLFDWSGQDTVTPFIARIQANTGRMS